MIIMNEYTLYQLITKKIVYLTDRSRENPLLLSLLEEYQYLQQQVEKKMYTGLDEHVIRELQLKLV